jgi:hypothetical protein
VKDDYEGYIGCRFKLDHELENENEVVEGYEADNSDEMRID